MTNFQVYKKTLSYSGLLFLLDLLALIVFGGVATGGFVIGSMVGGAIPGLIIGVLVGIILVILYNYLVQNRIKAAQIGMMAKGVVDGELPEHTFQEGFKEVKGRFASITGFFFVTNAIKGIFRQLGRGITRVGQAIGGDAGGSIASAIDSAIQILIGYLCDCCLGWVMYNKNTGTAKAACEGAVIFFRHGKTLFRNIGRIFGMGLLSFLVFGGAFFGLSFFICNNFPGGFEALSNEIIASFGEGEEVPEILSNITYLMLFVSAIIGIVGWSMLHNVLIRPFILTGVLRNFMASGLAERPQPADFTVLDGRSKKFAKLHEKVE